MTPSDRLSLPEEIMLLALHDEKGTTRLDSMYQYALGGAVLAELLLHQRIRLDSSKKKSVQLISAKPLGDPLLDECLTKVQDSRKPAAAQTWVSRFAGVKKLKMKLATGLCDKGVLRADQDKVLLLFSRDIYPEMDPEPEREIIGRLHRAIFTETDRLDPRTVVLLSLAKSAGLLDGVFEKRDLKTRKDRIERVIRGEALGQATQEAIKAVQAAVFVACILPAVITTVAH